MLLLLCKCVCIILLTALTAGIRSISVVVGALQIRFTRKGCDILLPIMQPIFVHTAVLVLLLYYIFIHRGTHVCTYIQHSRVYTCILCIYHGGGVHRTNKNNQQGRGSLIPGIPAAATLLCVCTLLLCTRTIYVYYVYNLQSIHRHTLRFVWGYSSTADCCEQDNNSSGSGSGCADRERSSAVLLLGGTAVHGRSSTLL